MSEKKKRDIKGILSSDKGRYLFIIIGIAAMLLILIGGRSDVKEKANTDTFDTEEYHTELTDEIRSMVESVEGAGMAKVLLTLEDSYEYVYLDDGRTLQKVNEPTIRGVVVACEGGGSAVVTAKITELLTTVLNVTSSKVCVSKLT